VVREGGGTTQHDLYGWHDGASSAHPESASYDPSLDHIHERAFVHGSLVSSRVRLFVRLLGDGNLRAKIMNRPPRCQEIQQKKVER
jgi:hypothetical protein